MKDVISWLLRLFVWVSMISFSVLALYGLLLAAIRIMGVL